MKLTLLEKVRKFGILGAIGAIAPLWAGCTFSVVLESEESSSPTPTAEVTSSPTVASGSFAEMEREVFRQVNQYRQSQNLPPLEANDRIAQEARSHSQAMAEGRVPFSHDGFEGRVEAIGSALTYRSAAENVAYNQGFGDPVSQAVRGWIESPGHQKNMVGDFDLTGVGIAKNTQGEYYFTQIFIKKR